MRLTHISELVTPNLFTALFANKVRTVNKKSIFVNNDLGILFIRSS